MNEQKFNDIIEMLENDLLSNDSAYQEYFTSFCDSELNNYKVVYSKYDYNDIRLYDLLVLSYLAIYNDCDLNNKAIKLLIDHDDSTNLKEVYNFFNDLFDSKYNKLILDTPPFLIYDLLDYYNNYRSFIIKELNKQH